MPEARSRQFVGGVKRTAATPYARGSLAVGARNAILLRKQAEAAEDERLAEIARANSEFRNTQAAEANAKIAEVLARAAERQRLAEANPPEPRFRKVLRRVPYERGRFGLGLDIGWQTVEAFEEIQDEQETV